MVTVLPNPVGVVVHTQQFRVHATVHMRSGSSTAWLMNTETRPFLSLTEVAMYRPSVGEQVQVTDLLYETRFAAVPKTHVNWLSGGAPDADPDGFGRRPRRVFVMYPDYVLSGLLHMRPELRLSDFLVTAMSDKPFQTLFDAAILEPGPVGTQVDAWNVLRREPFVTVNLRLAGGVFDSRGSTNG